MSPGFGLKSDAVPGERGAKEGARAAGLSGRMFGPEALGVRDSMMPACPASRRPCGMWGPRAAAVGLFVATRGGRHSPAPLTRLSCDSRRLQPHAACRGGGHSPWPKPPALPKRPSSRATALPASSRRWPARGGGSIVDAYRALRSRQELDAKMRSSDLCKGNQCCVCVPSPSWRVVTRSVVGI